MALAAATFSAHGVRPAPRLVSAVNTPQVGWVTLEPLGDPFQVFPKETADAIANALITYNLPIWQSIAVTPNGTEGYVSWYLAGTLPGWNANPLTLIVLLEENDPVLAELISHPIFKAALTP